MKIEYTQLAQTLIGKIIGLQQRIFAPLVVVAHKVSLGLAFSARSSHIQSRFHQLKPGVMRGLVNWTRVVYRSAGPACSKELIPLLP